MTTSFSAKPINCVYIMHEGKHNSNNALFDLESVREIKKIEKKKSVSVVCLCGK